MFGYTRGELIGKNVSLVIDAENLKNEPIQFNVIMSGQTVLRERKMVHRNGTIIEVEATVKVFPDNRIVAIARDITARKKMEKELRENEFMFRKVTENEIIGVAWATSEGRLMNANHAFCKMLGYTVEELKDVYFGDFTHPDIA
jgi:PAS domain-containing protein